MNAARLPEARLHFPELAMAEAHAEQRLRAAVARGDMSGGAHAMADWIDAQCAMLTYLELDYPDTMTKH